MSPPQEPRKKKIKSNTERDKERNNKIKAEIMKQETEKQGKK